MTIRNAIASLAVRDLGTSQAWYQRLFGRPADSSAMPGLAEWHFEGGGWLQVYQLPQRAGQGSVTLSVSNIDEQIAQVQAWGGDTSERSANAQVKTLMITDPDGNHIAFAQALTPDLAH